MTKKVTGFDLAKLINEAMGLKMEVESDDDTEAKSEEAPTEQTRVDPEAFTGEIPLSRGALGDLQLQDYGKKSVKIPSFYRDVFENSGILSSDSLRGRIEALENYANFLIKDKKNDSSLLLQSKEESSFSVEQEVGNVFVLDALADILSQAAGRDASGLQDLGFLTEGFVALLFSGAKIGSDSGWTDVITDVEQEGNFSVKFMAKKSTNYQALSTVYNHFQKSSEPMRFLNIVKSSITKNYNEIKFFMTRYTKDDFLEATQKMNLSYGKTKGKDDTTKIQGATDYQSTKALITTDGVKYYFENPLAFAPTKGDTGLAKTDLDAPTQGLTATAKINAPLDGIDVPGDPEEPSVSTAAMLKKLIIKYEKRVDRYDDANKELEKLKKIKKPTKQDTTKITRIEKYKIFSPDNVDLYKKAKKELPKLRKDLETRQDYNKIKSDLKPVKKGAELKKSLRGTYSVDKGKQPRITFTEFGDLVGTLTMPSLKDFNEAKRNRLKSLNTKIVQITDNLKELQAAAVLFTSTAEDSDKKSEAAVKVNEKFKESKVLLAGELGERSKIEESKEQKITADFLKKLISESFKK